MADFGTKLIRRTPPGWRACQIPISQSRILASSSNFPLRIHQKSASGPFGPGRVGLGFCSRSFSALHSYLHCTLELKLALNLHSYFAAILFFLFFAVVFLLINFVMGTSVGWVGEWKTFFFLINFLTSFLDGLLMDFGSIVDLFTDDLFIIFA